MQQGITVREAFEQWIEQLPEDAQEDATIVMRMTAKYRYDEKRAQRFEIKVHDFDDLFQTALLAYYQAKKTYTPDKGLFLNWARLAISNALRALYKFRSRSVVAEMLSQLSEEHHPAIESPGYLHMETLMTLTSFVKTLSRREQRVLSYMLQGFEKTEIHRAMHPVALSTIWRDVHKIQMKLISYADTHSLTGWLYSIHELVPDLFVEKAGKDHV